MVNLGAGRIEELGLLAKRIAIRTCWSQWIGLGSPATGGEGHFPTSIIDVEALLVASFALSHHERRLEDMVRWWARVGSQLTSVQRFRSLGRRFPEVKFRGSLEFFSAVAVASGDRRWRTHQGVAPEPDGRLPKGSEQPSLLNPCALWPRLRAGLGVGSKADTLTFLLGLQGARATVGAIAFATGYSAVSIRPAAEEMALARLIRVTEGRPSEYLAPPEPWEGLLEMAQGHSAQEARGELPRWRYWSEIFAFLMGVVEWSERAVSEPGANPHVSASRARDLMEKHRKVFTLNHIPAPPPASFPGLQAPEGLMEVTKALAEWAEGMI
jgi:hypothetical protein